MSVNRTDDRWEEAYRRASPSSAAAFARGCRSMPGGAKGAYYYPPYPLQIARAEGCRLFDQDGNCYRDFANHHTAQILGHGHPAIIEAVQEQLRRGIAVGAPMGCETALAEEICRRVGSIDSLRFCNSGTEATLHAVRLARGFTGRSKIAKFEGGYHGSHDAVEVSITPPIDLAGPADAPRSVAGTGGMAPRATDEVLVLPYGDAEAVDRLVGLHHDELACVLFDPKVGVYDTTHAFAQAVRQITERHQVLLILDEVVSFRLARGGYQEVVEVTPDLTTLGKLIGGGFPVGAVGGRRDIMALFDNTSGATGFGQSGTFSAHPVAMTAGLTTLEQLDPAAFAQLNQLGSLLRRELATRFAQGGQPWQIVGEGSLFSLYPTRDMPANYRAAAAIDRSPVRDAFARCLNAGVFLNHNLVMNAISLATGTAEVEHLVSAWETLIGAGVGKSARQARPAAGANLA
ncbi:MAG: aspartate aminotransferase family protein [Planctomycetaceae bacterium]|nr:aspartate aminotransferase family protein [Planctomycetaceae bacterium]